MNNNQDLETYLNSMMTTLQDNIDSVNTSLTSKINAKPDKLTMYPVGSIYQSTGSTSPASLFGGSWERFTNRFLVGAGDLYAVNAMGGEEEHTLNISEMPSHQHSGSDSGHAFLVDLNRQDTSSDFAILSASTMQYRCTVNRGTAFTGGTQPHNNMPPYYAVNIWRRTA